LDKAPVKILNLSNNGIRDEGVRYLKEVITTKRTITELWLNGNEISDQGVEALAKALKHEQTNLKKLYLHNNKFITDASVNPLIDMLKRNQSLDTLSLTDCNLTDYGRRKLREAVKSKKKFYLDVENFDSS
jgi:Ran GTPase-activating protein (RanGAP) involved in mRNA processing and transport